MTTRTEGSDFYLQSMQAIEADGVPFLVGGAFALREHAGIIRDTKDFDVMVRRRDLEAALTALRGAGFPADVVFPHWLAKAHHGPQFVDIIFNSGNGVCPVDDAWFDHAIRGEAFGHPVALCPPEEMIWQKAYIMERERFDGADVAHLLRAQGPRLDWGRLLARFADHPGVLLIQVLLARFVFPAAPVAPTWVVEELICRERLAPRTAADLCRGPLVSRAQYLHDLSADGLRDARLAPDGGMSDEDIRQWTNAIERDRPTGL